MKIITKKIFSIIKRITPFLIIFLYFAFFFDIGVTFYNYKTNFNYFINAESNHSLVGELKEGVYFWKSSTVWVYITTYLMMFLIFYRIESFKKIYIQRIILLEIFTLTIYQIVRHIIGGMSWI
jgi:hypothetical protein